jgi:hypothetical protein
VTVVSSTSELFSVSSSGLRDVTTASFESVSEWSGL